MRRSILALVIVCVFASLSYGQWLDQERQDGFKRLWEATGVEWPEDGKFYHLQRLSQRLVKVDDGLRGGIFDVNYGGSENINQQAPWATPSGLHWSPQEQWYKVGLVSFPKDKKVKVWAQLMPVLNSFNVYQDEYQTVWQFPSGTIFAEMLVRRENHTVFEIRRRERGPTGWYKGITYTPWSNIDDLPIGAIEQTYKVDQGKLRDLGFNKQFDVPIWVLPNRGVSTEETTPHVQPKLYKSTLKTTAVHDNAIVPRNYMGHITKCTDCHAQAGRSVSYGATTIPGSDTILSWHPFSLATLNTDQNPIVDNQTWPLEILR